VRWPKYIHTQRHSRILQHRLKIPPSIHQFSSTLDSHTKKELFKFAMKYKPETRLERRQRLKKTAEEKSKTPSAAAIPKRIALRYGLQCITRLVETKRAKMVLIAHDVVPLELVLWLPALCRKQDVPYCIVKSKAALGQLSGFKVASCIAFEKIKTEDTAAFNKLVESVRIGFNDKYEETRKHWGGQQQGRRTRDKARTLAKLEKKKDKASAK
jgi:large subunit ribosomal protein L7Ae